MSDAALNDSADARGTSRARFAAVLGIGVFNFVALVLVMIWSELLNDPDTHWHIAVGRWIADHRAFPRVDMFSHTFAGQPWIAKEWLSQLALHLSHAAAGWAGPALLTALAVAASLGLLVGWLAMRLRDTLVVGLVMFVLMLAASSLLARPHIVALPLMLIWVLGVVGAVEARRAPHWLLLPVMTLWANAHAGFTIGFVIAAFMAAEAVRAAGASERRATAASWALFITLAVLASCVGPYGPESFLVTLRLFGGGEALPFIREWQPLELDFMGLLSLALLAALLVGLAFDTRQNIMRIVLIAVLGWLMVRHARFAMVFAFTALPIAAAPLAASFPRLASRLQGRLTVPVWFAAAASLVIILGCALMAPAPRPSAATTPAAALEAARRAGLAGPVLNSYDFGGYLIAQGVPTFIDGRTDQLFLGGFLGAFSRAHDGAAPAPLLALAARHGATWAMVEANSRAAGHFDAAGWTQVHRDPVAAVFAAPGAAR